MTWICLILFLPFLGNSQSPISAFDDSGGPLKKGIIFHENKKVLVAEKFINVEFLLPFPKFAVYIKSDLEHILSVLATMWDMPTFNCYLNFTNVSLEGFHVNWLLTEVQNETQLTENALNTLQLEIATFLHPPLPPSQHDRPRRAIPLAAVAVGAIGLFSTGIAMGS